MTLVVYSTDLWLWTENRQKAGDTPALVSAPWLWNAISRLTLRRYVFPTTPVPSNCVPSTYEPNQNLSSLSSFFQLFYPSNEKNNSSSHWSHGHHLTPSTTVPGETKERLKFTFKWCESNQISGTWLQGHRFCYRKRSCLLQRTMEEPSNQGEETKTQTQVLGNVAPDPILGSSGQCQAPAPRLAPRPYSTRELGQMSSRLLETRVRSWGDGSVAKMPAGQKRRPELRSQKKPGMNRWAPGSVWEPGSKK